MFKFATAMALIVGGTYASLSYAYGAITGPVLPPSFGQFAEIAAVSMAICVASNLFGYRILSNHFAK